MKSDPPDAPPIRDSVHRFGLRRSARQRTLVELANGVKAACVEDDAPDKIVGMLAIVVRLDPHGKPQDVRRFCTVWGEPGFMALCQASEDTLKHVGRRIMANRAEREN